MSTKAAKPSSAQSIRKPMRSSDRMSRTPARFTQADVARTIRAAKQAGAGAVELLPDGTIRIRLDGGENPPRPVEPDREVVL
jgi:hypothetical protein